MAAPWWLTGRVVLEGEGRNQRVVIGETCGAPTADVAQWIVNRHNYEIMPWWRRIATKAPRLQERD